MNQRKTTPSRVPRALIVTVGCAVLAAVIFLVQRSPSPVVEPATEAVEPTASVQGSAGGDKTTTRAGEAAVGEAPEAPEEPVF